MTARHGIHKSLGVLRELLPFTEELRVAGFSDDFCRENSADVFRLETTLTNLSADRAPEAFGGGFKSKMQGALAQIKAPLEMLRERSSLRLYLLSNTVSRFQS